jgi:hypothetical protein
MTFAHVGSFRHLFSRLEHSRTDPGGVKNCMTSSDVLVRFVLSCQFQLCGRRRSSHRDILKELANSTHDDARLEEWPGGSGSLLGNSSLSGQIPRSIHSDLGVDNDCARYIFFCVLLRALPNRSDSIHIPRQN